MEETRDESLDLLIELAAPGPDDVVLDYAVVPGLAAFMLAPSVGVLESVAGRQDILEEGRRLAAEIGLTNTAFRLVDLFALPHPAETFSLVTCCEGLHLSPDPTAALAELRRVTTPSGRIVLVEPVVDEVLDGPFNELAGLLEPAHQRYYRIHELEQLAAKVGLRVASTSSVRRTVDLEYWVQTAGAPSARAALVGERFRALPVSVQLRLDAAFSDAAISFSYEVCGLRLERS